jgi:hypothetical protein
MTFFNFQQLRLRNAAYVLNQVAAWGKMAAGRKII